ncbi:hypothetical protein BAE44_0004709 [Dichanthelium oligosanthes]|uniref:MSP domain-containing protein n=1 Tax=Dichanthelium oligosanthes TaxID=888268 RepID=A0A1E5WA58_9POAL|nr:hypothetical protein BAE44_0004709 [Dichanthelium oligosanthes]
MYVVTITVQAQDVREHNHADKFIVRSMKASEGLREEEITECMSGAEARKVVDEVDLMVVYETTKPQENCKRREETNMPAEEVPEAKKRKTVESVSGKGKKELSSSENAEAASMDINSSAKGQYNLHPLQSFSRHHPTNEK